MRYTFLFLILLVYFACDTDRPVPECITPSEIIDLSYDQREYNSKVLSYLKYSQPTNYRYFFKSFIEGDQHTYMLTNFRNDETCFDVMVLVEDWSLLGGMRKVNGKSYPKELRRLKWEVFNDTTVRYIKMDSIID